ncbi:putative toxin-antitoxin system toxin component, PIN family [Archangium violaceum]|uniref:Twitching motility protein PilT n=1 Tax=Archangium violaceum Cb vi76 TaxID=1406225 RepID=A0A084SVV0_9BACT|nr:putative toxin-antitoxin system toxin component, PIN family [Archangium violaceum]KFA92585.1 twitching motility protein PilT [Archangium violaceum Cb vi76]
MSSPSASAPLPVVLDTNVVLDLLVFDDPHVRPLARALSAGEVTAWADAETLKELELVLAYPSFALDEAARRELQERYQRLVCMAPGDTGTPPSPLPRCRDRDDQKFLVLAARVGASWLVSKDKRVLALAGHKQVPFDILTSRQMAERLLQRER